MDNAMSRRELVKSAGIAALGVMASTVSAAQSPEKAQASSDCGAAREFPSGFFWGTATSATRSRARGTRTAKARRSGTRTRTRPARFATARPAMSPMTTTTATRKTSR